MRDRGGRIFRSAALAAALACLVACERQEPAPIVLVSIDTLRSDRLPVYGYEGIATPHIDALRRDSILFERAYSPAPTTLPAHASMLTGLLPPDHAVRGNVGYTLDAAALPYLPRLLREAGYATGAAVSSFVMRRETGLDNGFDLYEDAIDYRANAGSAGLQRAGPQTLEAILPWLRDVAGRPFFLFLHLYDPHTPYAPPEPYASRYESAYDGEIAAVDEVIGALVEELRSLRVYERAAVLMTSDHGEGLGDHGESEHGIFLYREAIQVPLLLKLPGGERAGDSVSVPAQLSDIFPTLLELAGRSGESRGDARSLVGLAAGGPERPIYAETYFPRFYFGWSELISVIEGRHHFIDSPQPELFDLIADPAERDNLVASGLEVERRLARTARGYEQNLVDPVDADFETWSRLASLGYIGHGQTRIDGELPAPASQVHQLEAIRRGVEHVLRGDNAAAAVELAAAVRANPYALVAWEQLGRALEQLGRLQEARAAYLRAVELSGSAPHLLLAAARTSLRTGALEQAEQLATRGLGWDQAEARTLLAKVALGRGDLDSAEAQARAVLELHEDDVGALLVLARVALLRGEYQQALDLTGRVEGAAGGPVPGLEFLRGNILASMGRSEEAESALRREVELFPSRVAGYPRLALFLARHGRPAEAVETLRQLVERNPTPAGYVAAVRGLEMLGDPAAAAALRNEARRRFPGVPELEGGRGRAVDEEEWNGS